MGELVGQVCFRYKQAGETGILLQNGIPAAAGPHRDVAGVRQGSGVAARIHVRSREIAA